MVPIYLRLGKSTVLRFSDKPRKVVVGNQNYYGLEFIENDLAIQPLGAVATNLFVYTDGHTYGFLLTPGERYDDLVFVRWRQMEERAPSREDTKPAKETHPNLSFKVGKALKVAIEAVKFQPGLGLYLIDGAVENVGKTEILLGELKLRATKKEKNIEKQDVVLEKDKLKPGEKSKLRLVLKLDEKADCSIEAKFGNDGGKVILGRKFL